MKTQLSTYKHKSKPSIGSRIVGWVTAVTALVMVASVHAGTVQLKNSSFVGLPGKGIELNMQFDAAPPTPTSYVIDSPPRMILDFAGVENATGARSMDVKTGVVDSINYAQADGRLRAVVSLTETVGYNIDVSGNEVRIILDGNASSAPASAQRSLTQEPVQPRFAEQRAEVRGIDFQRVEGNVGRVTITLSDQNANVDILREAGNVIVNLEGAQLSQNLEKRLDVQDFATPLMFIDSQVMGRSATIMLRPSAAPHDYMAYQTGNQLIIDFKPLTPREQAERDDARNIFTGERIDLNFQNVDIRAVLQIIAEVAEKNLVVSDNVQGTITLRLKNVPWDQALDIILKARNLDKREAGNVLMVGTMEEIAKRELQEAESLRTVEEVAPLLTEFIQIDFRRASDMKERLEDAMMISERGFVMADDQTNVLMIRETARQLEDIRRTVRRLDAEVAQILVEARVVETTSRDAKELGIRWGFGGRRMVAGSGNLLGSNAIGGSGAGLGNVGNFAPGEILDSDGGLMDLGVTGQPATVTLGLVSGSALLAAEISALETTGRLNVVSQPKIVTANGQTATISSGRRVPYQVVEDGTITIQFVEVDLSLNVTPQINPGDRINLDLRITKDDIGGETSRGDLIIDKNHIETSITINDGETIVLGGIFIDSDRNDVDKTPILGDIPVLGNLFKRTVKRTDKRELLIFVTPTMIRESLAVQ